MKYVSDGTIGKKSGLYQQKRGRELFRMMKLKEVVDDSQDHFNENFCNSEIRESKLMKTISRKSSEIFER